MLVCIFCVLLSYDAYLSLIVALHIITFESGCVYRLHCLLNIIIIDSKFPKLFLMLYNAIMLIGMQCVIQAP